MRRHPASGNLLTDICADPGDAESFQQLIGKPGLRIERIVSTGQASPPGFWYDDDSSEWVMVLAGEAGLLIEGEDAPRTLKPGDWIDLPPHCRHRVEWTSAGERTIWLAVHYGQSR